MFCVVVSLLQVRVKLGVIAMKGHSRLPRSSELEPQHEMQFSIKHKTFLLVCVWEGLTPLQGIQLMYSNPH